MMSMMLKKYPNAESGRMISGFCKTTIIYNWYRELYLGFAKNEIKLYSTIFWQMIPTSLFQYGRICKQNFKQIHAILRE